MPAAFRYICALLVSLAAAHPAVAAGEITVHVDRLAVVPLAHPPGEVFVGNAGIADVSVSADRRIVVQGRAPGRTDILVTTREGEIAEAFGVHVTVPRGQPVTLIRGTHLLVHDCAPDCRPEPGTPPSPEQLSTGPDLSTDR